MRRTIILAALAVSIGLVAATTFGSTGAARSTVLGSAASVAPANAVAFVALDTNLSSSQWSTVDGLLQKLPQHAALLTQLQQDFATRTKLDWTNDVEPALGSELDVVVLPGARKAYVGLTQPHDQAKLDALLQKAHLKSQQVGGWTAFAATQAALDAFAGGGARLSADPTYTTATGKLAGDALVHLYANGVEAQKLVDAVAPAGAQPRTVPFQWASADVTASGDGLRAHVYAHDGAAPAGSQQAQPYASRVLDQIPAGVLAVADLVVTPQIANAQLPPRVQKLLGNVPLGQILGGETAVYVRPGLPIPELTIVTQPSDPQAAAQALAKVSIPNVQLVHQVLGGQLVVSTSQKGLDDFRSAGPKLSADPLFSEAQRAAGMPAQTTGFLYVNLKDALPLARLAAPMLGLKLSAPLQTADLSALRSLTAYGTRTGADRSYTVFLQVR